MPLLKGWSAGTPMVEPKDADAPFRTKGTEDGAERSISADIGTLTVTSAGELRLQDPEGRELTRSMPLALNSRSVAFASTSARFYGHGASPQDAHDLTSQYTQPLVCNRATYVPHYYSTDGYAALASVNNSDGNAALPVTWKSTGAQVIWSWTGEFFELYLMPAATLSEGTQAYYALTGAPAVLPRYAFGFIASRWGWKDKGYIDWILWKFRKDRYPIDGIIIDFEWYTPQNDYAFGPKGKAEFLDFASNPKTFPDLARQLTGYHNEKHVRMGGIRKPRLGNTQNIEMAKGKGWIFPGGEPAGTYPPNNKGAYGLGRSLNFSRSDVREWYSNQLQPLVEQGVDFWWNDEGETDYWTYHWWNVAEIAALRATSADRRFFSLNRAWTPGMARFGAAAWTGDIGATWEDLAGTPGMMLNWILAGAPYVACDIGGFGPNTTSFLLSRWMQVGIFMPLMRVHSAIDVVPHWPWRLGENVADIIRGSLELRYRLLPYHYSLAHRLHDEGKLWIRPLVVDFPDDPFVSGITSEWLDGEILAAPVLDQKSERNITLPEGTWYTFQTWTLTSGPATLGGYAPLDEVLAFVRPGTIVTLAPKLQYSEALPGGALEVQVYAGSDGKFTLVEDDGQTMGYQTGKKRSTAFWWNNDRGTLSWTVSGDLHAPGSSAFTEVVVTIFDGFGEFGSAPGVKKSSQKGLAVGGMVTFDKHLPQRRRLSVSGVYV
jgi:alpha-glucosidase